MDNGVYLLGAALNALIPAGTAYGLTVNKPGCLAKIYSVFPVGIYSVTIAKTLYNNWQEFMQADPYVLIFTLANMGINFVGGALLFSREENPAEIDRIFAFINGVWIVVSTGVILAEYLGYL